MHLFNDNSPLPPQRQLVHVMCTKPQYATELPHHDVGKMFLDLYTHNMVTDLVEFYLNARYQGNHNLIPLYADISENIVLYFEHTIDFTACNLFDEAALAEALHPIAAETILNYFNHDSCLIGDAAVDVLLSLHEVMFYPVMNMITLCGQSGLTLLPDNYEEQVNGFCIIMEIGEDELIYDRYDDESYVAAPFRCGLPRVRTTAEIGGLVHRHRPVEIPSLVRQPTYTLP